MYTVYLRTNTVNGKQYVGQTGDFKTRNNQWNCLKGNYSNKDLNEDRIKYGLDIFNTIILAQVETEEESLKLEEQYIKELNTLKPNGYNISIGGKKNSGSGKGNKNPFYGKKHTNEAKHKMSKIRKGKHHSEETKKKMSEAHKGEKSHMYGTHLSEETKKKLSHSLKGRKAWNKGKKTGIKMSEEHKQKLREATSKPIARINEDNSLTVFNSVSEAINSGFSRHCANVANGKRKTSNGHKWMGV